MPEEYAQQVRISDNCQIALPIIPREVNGIPLPQSPHTDKSANEVN